MSEKPVNVRGPDGSWLNMGNLPPANTLRYTAQVKATIACAVSSGLLSTAAARERWRLTEDELEGWLQKYATASLDALRQLPQELRFKQRAWRKTRVEKRTAGNRSGSREAVGEA